MSAAHGAADVMDASPTPPSNSASPSPLATLPEELLTNVSCKLGSDDLFALRQTCRSIEAKTFHDFATEYFSAKGFMFTTESLKVLINIAKHPKLKESLKEVWFITAYFPRGALHCGMGKCCHWQPTVRQREAFNFYVADQERLQIQGDDRRLITVALTLLPAMRRLSIVDHTSAIPARAECRGLQKVSRTTNNQASFHPSSKDAAVLTEYYEWLSHIFRTVMLSVADSGQSTITKLETRFHHITHGLSPSVDLSFKRDESRSLSAALANLTKLRLQYRTNLYRKGKADDQNERDLAMKTMRSFSSIVRNTTNVRLTSDDGKISGLLARAMTSKMELENITRFSMESIAISDTGILKAMLLKMLAVEKLTFYFVNIKSSAGWAPVLQILPQLPALNHLHLMYLQDNGRKVYLIEQPDDDELDNWGHEAAAEDEDEWIADESSDDDDDLPDLIDADESVDENSDEDVLDVEEKPAEPTIPKVIVPPCKHAGKKDYTLEGREAAPERGYWVCLNTREAILAELPRFIKDINIGEPAAAFIDDMAMFGNAVFGPPPGAAQPGMITVGAGAFGLALGAGPPPAMGPPGMGVPPATAMQAIAQLSAALGVAPPPFGPPAAAPPPPAAAAAPTTTGTNAANPASAPAAPTAPTTAASAAPPPPPTNGWSDWGFHDDDIE
ncbi:uncharacterized protein MYCGRDRAFT_92320 [Zymoseptoria tritici IPO323]|uniref:F-box domain-containing protein n=1 Tax=Zymoseptoria tritici (strain CBS 115943 / IPO323) TaxID=336722 RepID=F9X8R9_ZYMTI|nr:uncharacterized protein MYCGRDRAFT_92320 [Zymoseptoria tritici IPO323]EGP88534.1 hypothetical protein MYCGRDRAFT_92320 [Zymoseptoria tritici IPO323]